MEQTTLIFASRYAREGYFVFPLIESHKGPFKPYGWARNVVDDKGVNPAKIIPATNDIRVVESWPELVEAGYPGQSICGYGVLGVNCVIFDLDLKNGKNGEAEFRKLMDLHKLPAPEFVVKSKSGGYHLYYAKNSALKVIAIKSVANVKLGATKYEGVDIRGDGGFVVGPMIEGPVEDWKPGQYQIIKGSPESVLSELPKAVCMALSKSSMGIEDTVKPIEQSMDEMDVLKRGEIPTRLSAGNRNNGFYIYLNALKNKGFNAETAKRYAQELVKVTEEADTLSDSVNIDDMIARIWRVDINNPYDVCQDLITHGLYRLTSYRTKIMYIILEDNPYLDSKSAHDLPSMKQLMQRFSRRIQNSDGKMKVINPAELIDSQILPDREVATLGFKPGAPPVFTLTEAVGGKKYLNTWRDPRGFIDYSDFNEALWKKFEFIVSRIFGSPGSDEYQLGLDFPAWCLQHPGIRPSIAPFIMSRTRGAGKSLYLSMLSQVFGYNKQGELQARQYKVEEIGTRFFNPSGSSMLLFDEVQFPVHRNMRQESAAFWKHLKMLVTLDTVPVEFKGGDVGVQMPNFAGIIMAGNTGNNFPIEEFDRRIWLIDNDPPELEHGVVDEFFAMQKNFLTAPEKRKILNTLAVGLSRHKIKLPLDRMRAPMNEIKREMYLSTLSDIEEWWITYFEDKDNLLAHTPMLTKSAILYLISTAERLMNSRWREDPEGTFRELKRRGLIQPIRVRGNNYQTRNLTSVPIIKADGTAIQIGQSKDVMYTSRQHGEYSHLSNDELMALYLQNINGINVWKKNQLNSKTQRLVDSM